MLEDYKTDELIMVDILNCECYPILNSFLFLSDVF
jgi:hypothetical protein